MVEPVVNPVKIHGTYRKKSDLLLIEIIVKFRSKALACRALPAYEAFP